MEVWSRFNCTVRLKTQDTYHTLHFCHMWKFWSHCMSRVQRFCYLFSAGLIGLLITNLIFFLLKYQHLWNKEEKNKCILMTYRLYIKGSNQYITNLLPLFIIIFKTSQPCFPVLQHQLWVYLVSMSWRAILVRNNNESIFNLQKSSCVWGELKLYVLGQDFQVNWPDTYSWCHCSMLQHRQPPESGCQTCC